MWKKQIGNFSWKKVETTNNKVYGHSLTSNTSTK